jgi:hypothetical protein
LHHVDVDYLHLQASKDKNIKDFSTAGSTELLANLIVSNEHAVPERDPEEHGVLFIL